jgi:DNA-binding NarL/FixJ family response regulator
MVDAARIAALRENGKSWRGIAREMKLSVGTVFAAGQARSIAEKITQLAA